MKCPVNIVYDPTCCNTIPLVPTEWETLFSTYYSCAKPLLDAFCASYNQANLFGKKDPVRINIDMMNDIHLLMGYLTTIYVEIQEDKANSLCGIPRPTSEYYDENKIDCIKATFICKGINITSLLAVFGLDDRNAKTLFDGINYMCIETCVPQDPACTNDDELFIVSKP